MDTGDSCHNSSDLPRENEGCFIILLMFGKGHEMRKILITDFDGTLCRQDFYQLVVAELLPPTVPNYWQQYLDQKLTHFEVLQRYFAEIRCTEAEVEKLLSRMELEPELVRCLEELRGAGWEVAVASAGCGWYIEKLLRHVQPALVVHANPGKFVEGQGLLMSLPYGLQFYSPITGIDKTAIVKAALAVEGPKVVAYAGDGLTDIIPSLLVSPEHRFARGDLARHLEGKGQRYQAFDRWREVAGRLLR
jgi:2-hydroxy-3-keto-5-methylthiopentenyl-1-phosphate phosphatase